MVTGVVPHVGGPIIKGEPTVMIGFLPAARIGDQVTCVGPPDVIIKGSPTVMIGYMPAAQIWAQRFVRAQRVALIFIMEPVCAAWMAWYVLDEHLGPRGWIGSALILVAVLLGSVLRSGPHMAAPVQTTERRAT